jgi:uncharacterized protein (DUF1684 family)
VDGAGDPTEGKLDLLDWKRRVGALYAGARAASDPPEGWERWRRGRDELFRLHPQSPLPPERQALFTGLDYFAYDPQLRILAEPAALPPLVRQVGTSGAQPIAFERFGEARFRLGEAAYALELYWLLGYGGGLFLPFADATSGSETYGGGRYLLDTVKGADLGLERGALLLDFNFAYNPSCSYDPHWVCPLSPPANRLAVAIRAGERLASG